MDAGGKEKTFCKKTLMNDVETRALILNLLVLMWGKEFSILLLTFKIFAPTKYSRLTNMLNYFIEVGAESWIQKTENERRHLLSKNISFFSIIPVHWLPLNLAGCRALHHKAGSSSSWCRIGRSSFDVCYRAHTGAGTGYGQN